MYSIKCPPEWLSFPITMYLCIAVCCVCLPIGPWGRCMGNECGPGGSQSRAVWCAHSEGWTTLHTNCEQATRPHNQQGCFRVCDWHKDMYDWQLGAWNQCVPVAMRSSAGMQRYAAAVAAGVCTRGEEGIQTREVACVHKSDAAPAEDAICEYFEPKPRLEQACLIPCPRDCVVSEFSPWTSCSKTCGTGLQNRIRSVLAPPLFGGAACPNLTEFQTCQPGLCEGEESLYSLRLGPWGPCGVPLPRQARQAHREISREGDSPDRGIGTPSREADALDSDTPTRDGGTPGRDTPSREGDTPGREKPPREGVTPDGDKPYRERDTPVREKPSREGDTLGSDKPSRERDTPVREKPSRERDTSGREKAFREGGTPDGDKPSRERDAPGRGRDKLPRDKPSKDSDTSGRGGDKLPRDGDTPALDNPSKEGDTPDRSRDKPVREAKKAVKGNEKPNREADKLARANRKLRKLIRKQERASRQVDRPKRQKKAKNKEKREKIREKARERLRSEKGKVKDPETRELLKRKRTKNRQNRPGGKSWDIQMGYRTREVTCVHKSGDTEALR